MKTYELARILLEAMIVDDNSEVEFVYHSLREETIIRIHFTKDVLPSFYMLGWQITPREWSL